MSRRTRRRGMASSCGATDNAARPSIFCPIRISASPTSPGSGRASARSIRKIAEQLETDAKYAVYLDRQAADVESYRRDEALALGDDLDYAALPGLSNEVRHKLADPQAADHRACEPDRRHHAGGADAAGGACPSRAPQAEPRCRMSTAGAGEAAAQDQPTRSLRRSRTCPRPHPCFT